MADWPELAALKRKLDVTSNSYDEDLELILEVAIEQVQLDVGEAVDTPTASIAWGALHLAVKLAETEGEPVADVAARLPRYQRALKGHRVRFGVA